MHQGESGGNLPGKTYTQTARQIYDDLCGDLGLEKEKVPFLADQAVGNNMGISQAKLAERQEGIKADIEKRLERLIKSTK